MYHPMTNASPALYLRIRFPASNSPSPETMYDTWMASYWWKRS